MEKVSSSLAVLAENPEKGLNLEFHLGGNLKILIYWRKSFHFFHVWLEFSLYVSVFVIDVSFDYILESDFRAIADSDFALFFRIFIVAHDHWAYSDDSNINY